jgi:gamma-glutamyl-gamma-aminobutyrate hydrolase PuuD
VVGVTTYRERARWGSWDRDAAVLASAYIDRVAAGGSWPVLLPPAGTDVAASTDAIAPGHDRGDDAVGDVDAGREAVARAVVERLDALVVVGGGDVDPRRYGAEPHPRTAGVDAGRDDHELALLRAALAVDLPVLAICRGLQLLNVLQGGRLDQHLPESVGDAVHQPARGCFSDVAVETVPGTATAAILGKRVGVRCSHHQAVSTVGDGLTVSARAADGTIEALEMPRCRFVVAVQWHPEEDDDPRLFQALRQAAVESTAALGSTR